MGTALEAQIEQGNRFLPASLKNKNSSENAVSDRGGITNIWFVRHGESVSNAGGLTLDHDAIPLTLRGAEQAQKVAKELPAEPAAILVSKYLRARQTADVYCARVAQPAVIHPLLHEFSALDPAFLQGMNGLQRRPIADRYWDTGDPNLRMGPAAETFREFAERVNQFIDALPQLQDRSVLFGHGIWFGLLAWKLQHSATESSADMKAFRAFQLAMRMSNCGIYLLSGPTKREWSWQKIETP